jgi:hypothetical protein
MADQMGQRQLRQQAPSEPAREICSDDQLQSMAVIAAAHAAAQEKILSRPRGADIGRAP